MDNIRCASSRFMYSLPQRKVGYADDGNALQVVGSRSLLPRTHQRIEDFIGNRFGSKPADGAMGKNRIECRFALHHDGAFKLGWQTGFTKNFSDGLSGIFKCLNNRIQQLIFGFQRRLVDHQAAGNISHMFYSFQTIGL